MGRRSLVFCRAAACLVVARRSLPPARKRTAEPCPRPSSRIRPAPQGSGQHPHRKREASEEIVVIGRLPRLPLPPSSVPASVYVIEEKEPQQSGHPNLPDSLAGQVRG